MQARVDWVLITFGTQVIKNSRFGPCLQTIFPFLMTMITQNTIKLFLDTSDTISKLYMMLLIPSIIA